MPDELPVTRATTAPKSKETERKASDSAPRIYLEHDIDIPLTKMTPTLELEKRQPKSLLPTLITMISHLERVMPEQEAL